MSTSYYVRALKRVVSETELRGLGDVIAVATKALGIPKCEPCSRRQATLNKLVPFKHVDPKDK